MSRRVFVPFLSIVAAAIIAASAPGAFCASESPGDTNGRAYQSLNPEISAVVDLFYHWDNSEEGIEHALESMVGFGHAHAGEEHRHELGSGFNLRHVELSFFAEIDPYCKAFVIAAVSPDGAELELAEIESTSLPGGLRLKGGKCFSDFGRINHQHSHEWDFLDRPLIHALTLGDHGLNDVGVQASWLVPVSFYCLLGAEAFQGENEIMFPEVDEGPLPSHSGPRVSVGWLKVGPNLPGRHGLEAGVFGGAGRRQEAHDGDGDGTYDHWLDGTAAFFGADVVYKYDDTRAYGRGDFSLQAEYLRRRVDLEVRAHDLLPALVGERKIDTQDGYYVQATYGFAPRWRAALRFEQAGLTNASGSPDGSSLDYGSSWRAAFAGEFVPSEFSRIRLQLDRGSYAIASGEREDVFEVMLQWTVSLGVHGAHTF